jgi:hypothetical protein
MRGFIPIVLALVGLVGCKTSFSDSDIDALKTTVKSEFEKRPGVSVSDVTFIKESERKLKGFVKLNVAELEVMKSCEATMGDNSQYIWKCE